MVTYDSRNIVISEQKTHSLLKVLQILTIKVMTTFYRRLVAVIQPLEGALPQSNQDAVGMLRPLTERDLSAYIKFRPKAPPRLIMARFTGGDFCFATWKNGQIANALWVATQKTYIPYLRRHLLLQKGGIYIYDHYTLPEYRGGGLGQNNLIYVFRHYQAKGYHRAISLLAMENKAAFGPIQRLGIPMVGLFGCLRLGPWQWDWKEEWVDGALPTLLRIK